MELEIPAAFMQVTKCLTSDLLEGGEVLVGLCTTSGQLIELIDNQIVDSFDIDQDADDIMIFTSYNPVQKYYLVRCKAQLIVIKRNKPLSIFKTYENVAQVQIQDRLCLGRPQAVIWILMEKEPIVTDFTNQVLRTSIQPVPQITTSLSGKLQEMNLRLEKARKILQEKRKTRINAFYQVAPHLSPPDTQVELKVLAWGPPFPVEKVVSPPPLQLSEPWRRVHNGKWIVGVPAFNTSTLSVENVRLRLQMDCQPELRYETHVIVFPRRVSSGADWTELCQHQPLFQRQSSISGNTSAVIVGVIEEPYFKKSSAILLSGAVLYRHCDSAIGTDIQDLLSSSPIEFKVEDLIHGVLKPFSSVHSSADECDLISVAVTSSKWQLCVSTRHHMSASLSLGDHGLQLISSLDCWIGIPGGSLEGLLVIHHQTSGSQHILQVYSREIKQVLLFLNSLGSQWKVEECRDPPVTLTSCMKSLGAELLLLLTTIKPNSDFTPEQWTEFRKKLSGRELSTDLQFLSYSPPD